jgi:hypothetical protein
VVDHELDHRGDQQHVGDAVLLDGGQHGDRVEHRDHHLRAAEHAAADPGREGGEVEHRRGVQEHAAGREVVGGEPAHGRRQQVVVAEHDALGPAGGAAGVEDAGELVAAAAGVLDRLGGSDQLLDGEHAVGGGAVPAVDDVPEPRVAALMPSVHPAKTSSTTRTRASTSASDSAISGTLHRMLTGTTTPPAHSVAARTSW